MIVKSVIVKERLRKVPESFSWIDHRLVREGYIDVMSHAEAALYLFLACVSDDKGLSYYGDKTIMKRLSMDEKRFENARGGLADKDLIAWRKPIYQVLDLAPLKEKRSSGQMTGIGDILEAMGGVHD